MNLNDDIIYEVAKWLHYPNPKGDRNLALTCRRFYRLLSSNIFKSITLACYPDASPQQLPNEHTKTVQLLLDSKPRPHKVWTEQLARADNVVRLKLQLDRYRRPIPWEVVQRWPDLETLELTIWSWSSDRGFDVIDTVPHKRLELFLMDTVPFNELERMLPRLCRLEVAYEVTIELALVFTDIVTDVKFYGVHAQIGVQLSRVLTTSRLLVRNELADCSQFAGVEYLVFHEEVTCCNLAYMMQTLALRNRNRLKRLDGRVKMPHSPCEKLEAAKALFKIME